MSKTAIAQEKLAHAKELFSGSSFVYRHRRGGIYHVNGFAVDTDDGEIRVLYHRIGGPEFDEDAEDGIQFARPVREWFEEVDGQLRFTQLE